VVSIILVSGSGVEDVSLRIVGVVRLVSTTIVVVVVVVEALVVLVLQLSVLSDDLSDCKNLFSVNND